MLRSPLYQGRIVYAVPPSVRGLLKIRPMVVGSDGRSISDSGRFKAVMLSSKIPDPLPVEQVLIPDDSHVRSVTKLGRECVAVCNWVELLSVGDIARDNGGWMPPHLLEPILAVAGLIRETSD